MLKGHRRQGRECALQVLYGLLPGQDPSGALTSFWQNFRLSRDELGEPLDDDASGAEPPAETLRFASWLVEGVMHHLPEIDGMVRTASHHWSLERMSRVDLTLLRLGTFELMHAPETPTNAVLNEAIEIGKRYGTRETSAFVNGILDRIAKQVRSGG